MGARASGWRVMRRGAGSCVAIPDIIYFRLRGRDVGIDAG